MSIQELAQSLNPRWDDPKAVRDASLKPRRDVFADLLGWLEQRDRRAHVLMGPRQVGKTTLLKQAADELVRLGHSPSNITYFDFVDPRLPSGGISPRQVTEIAPRGVQPARPRFFLFDEIGGAIHWDKWLKSAVDAESGDKFLVTDSSSVVLRKGGHESGVGRWDEHWLEGLSFREFIRLQSPPDEALERSRERASASVGRYFQIGGRPEHLGGRSLQEIRDRTRGDTADRAIARDLARFDLDVLRVRDLFVYLVDNSGGIADVGKLTREVGDIDRRTLAKWLEHLEHTMLLASLSPFGKSPGGRLSQSRYPKVYAADHGLISAFSTLADPLADHHVLGRVLEAAVFQELRQFVRRRELTISYLREAKGEREIDFVLHRGNEILALIEVTASADASKKRRALDWAVEDHPKARVLVLHTGVEVQREGAIWSAPVEEFLLDASRWLP